MNGKERNVPPKLEINVMRVAGDWSKSIPGYTAKVKKWSAAALKDAGKGALSVVLADNAFIHDLNRTYRGKNKPTNVLAFPSEEGELGDVILAYETVKKEAKLQKKPFARHVAHLVVHGCLHLVGYDHENERDADKMEALEIRVLARLGIANPYQTSA
jgi:probable rRNA maturation factor